MGVSLVFVVRYRWFPNQNDFLDQYVLVTDCQIFDFDLNLLRRFPGMLCEYDFENEHVLSAQDEALRLYNFAGELLWSIPHSQVNHDIAIHSKSRTYYSLDYEQKEVNGQNRTGSLLRAFDKNGKTLYSWSSLSLYEELLSSPYRELLLGNGVNDEVRIGGGSTRLDLLINNIQFLEETPLALRKELNLERDRGRYLVLSFANLNHLALFDSHQQKIIWRYDLFKVGEGGYFHTPSFIDSKHFYAFLNINLLESAGQSDLLYQKKFYSNVCLFNLETPAKREHCWLDKAGIAAPIMGSVQPLGKLLLISYCDSHLELANEKKTGNNCRVVLIDKEGSEVWNSSNPGPKQMGEYLAKGHLYRASAFKHQDFAPLLQSR